MAKTTEEAVIAPLPSVQEPHTLASSVMSLAWVATALGKSDGGISMNFDQWRDWGVDQDDETMTGAGLRAVNAGATAARRPAKISTRRGRPGRGLRKR